MRRTRGQALTEMALGLLVFVTVLLFGIAFGEWGFLSLKVHEAASSAVWDTTARQMHEHPNKYGPRNRAIRAAGPRATALYAQFDGREAFRNKRSGLQSLTSGGDLRVTCSSDDVIPRSTVSQRRIFQGGEGGMECSARAGLALRLDVFPVRFAEGINGFFAAPHAPRTLIPVCGLGRSNNGSCTDSTYALMLDTWALTGKDERDDCSLRNCKNKPFSKLVEALYQDSQRGAGRESARDFARAVTGGNVPGQSSRTFRFSFVNSKGDPGFKGGDADPADWMTNVGAGSRNIRYWNRGKNFLGEWRTRN